jgi:hypothetical protein
LGEDGGVLAGGDDSVVGEEFELLVSFVSAGFVQLRGAEATVLTVRSDRLVMEAAKPS